MIETLEITDLKKEYNIEEGSNDYIYYQVSHVDPSIFDKLFQLSALLTGFCLKGSIEISVGINRFKLNPFDFLIITPYETIQIHEVSDDFVLEEVIISKDFLSKINISTKMLIDSYIYVEQNHHKVSITDEENKELILVLFESISKFSKYHANLNFQTVIQHYIYAFLNVISFIYEQYAPNLDIDKNAKLSLLKHFFLLLQKHYKKEHSVNFYANKLCVTTKYLSKYIKNITGRTTGEWIRSIIILEAKIMLSKKDILIQEVAQDLNFSDQMTFSKFFKKYTGFTPKQYKSTLI